MQFRSFVVLFLVLTSAVIAAACGASPTGATTVSAVTVSGAVPAVGSSAQFSAVATLGSGTTQDVTTGLVVSITSGTAVISATYSGVAGADSITVP